MRSGSVQHMLKPKKAGLRLLRLLTGVILFSALQTVGICRESKTVFSTWDIFEPDKLASIWLIKRFIDPEARIKLYPKGEPITEGIPFDTPDAEFRRYHNISTYEMFRQHYKIDDPRCRYISRIIHDIEINTWEKKVMVESRFMIDAVQKIVDDADSPDEIILKGIRLFDHFYDHQDFMVPAEP